jgi:hypothetical protein
MRSDGMERAVITPLGLLAVSERTPTRQFVSHVQGDHPKKDGNEKDCRDKKE